MQLGVSQASARTPREKSPIRVTLTTTHFGGSDGAMCQKYRAAPGPRVSVADERRRCVLAQLSVFERECLEGKTWRTDPMPTMIYPRPKSRIA